MLKARQIPLGDLPTKPTIGDKIEPLGFQRVGLENEQLGATWLRSFVVIFGMGKC